MSDSRITTAWQAMRASGRTALVPYLTAGYPTPADSIAALQAIDEFADIIEVGVPFSDPLADGPTIQASTFRALENGMTLPLTLEAIASANLRAPVVLFTYLNPVLRYGVDRLLRDAATAGVSGVLLTDLPAGADALVETAIHESPIDLIRLIAPTTTRERMERAVSGAEGFLYLIARLGVTGTSTTVSADLGDTVARVRDVSALPIAVGFGVSTPAQARQVGTVADGVVVGSALVERLGRDGVSAAARFMGEIRAALDEK